MKEKDFLFSVVTGLIALMLVGTSCYMWATEQEVPEGLIGLDGVVCTFFFVQTGGNILRRNGNGSNTDSGSSSSNS